MPLHTSRHDRFRRVKRYRRRFFVFVLVAMGFASALGLLISETHQTLAAKEGPLRVWFFDVGQGDAIFIEAPTGEQMLIDGGRDQSILNKLGSAMYPWDRTIDAIVLTHPDADHITGFISVLERYQVGTILDSGATATTQTMRRLEEGMERESADRRYVSAGDTLMLGNVHLTVLAPEKTHVGEVVKDRNNDSVVLLVEYGSTSILLTGDAENPAEHIFADAAGNVDVLKVGHHGSLTSSGVDFLATVRPEFSIVSAGLDNSYGHPHPVVLQRLTDIGSLIFRTDLDGDILLRSWGGEPELRAAPLPF